MQILEGDLLRKMNSSRKKREIKGRKKEREQEETCPEMSSVCKHPKPSACIK